MKILLLLALLVGTSSFSFAQSRISEAVASELSTKKKVQFALPQTKKSSRPNPEFYPSLLSLDKLEEMKNPANWQNISWKDFLRLNKHAQEVEACSFRLESCLFEKNSKCPIPLPYEEIVSFQQGYPDYETLLQNETLIYIAEAINHNTQKAPLEVSKILRTVRKINPNAKILLAAEFANWIPYITEIDEYYNALEEYKEILPLCHWLKTATPEEKEKALQPEVNIQEIEDLCLYLQDLKGTIEMLSLYRSASFLKKAGTPSYLHEMEEYSSIFQTANELEIDLLALDDHVIDKQKDGSISVKVGNFLVNIPQKTSIPNLTGNREQDASQFLKVSSWGIKERTRDWAQRIKTVLADYDIVLVYAGSGHLEYTYFTDLQPMVEKEPFVNITLYPLENLPKGTQDYFTNRFVMAEENCFSQDCKLYEEKKKREQQYSGVTQAFLNKIQAFLNNQAEELVPPFSMILFGEKETEFLNQHKEEIAEWEKEMERCDFMKFSASKHIEVYLPAQ